MRKTVHTWNPMTAHEMPTKGPLSCHPWSLLWLFPCWLLKTSSIIPAFPFHPQLIDPIEQNPNSGDGRMKPIYPSSEFPPGSQHLQPLQDALGGNVNYGGLRKVWLRSAVRWQGWKSVVTNVAVTQLTHCSTLNIWEEGGIKKCFPTSSLLNSNCQTVPRPNHERGCSSAGKKNMSVVCLPCLRWEAKYLTDEETWHTKSFFLSFKNTKGQSMPGYPIYLGLQFHRISHTGQGN